MNSERYVLDAIAELEAEDRDDISELVYRQITEGAERGEHLPEWRGWRFTGPAQYALYLSLIAALPQWDLPDDPLTSG